MEEEIPTTIIEPMLDNRVISVNVRAAFLYHTMETLPNPFGVVNTYLCRNMAYMIGIVPFGTRFLYSGLGKDVTCLLVTRR